MPTPIATPIAPATSATSVTSPLGTGNPITSFDFEGALKSGATPQQISTYLSQNGAGALAQTYFNQASQSPNGFSQGIQSLGNFIKSVAAPFTTGAATGVRAVEATPKVAAAVGDAMIGNKANEQSNIQQANQTMAKPMFGQNTLEGNTNEQNLGEAAQAASFLVPGAAEAGAGAGATEGLLGNAATGAGIGAVQGAGQAMTQNENTSDVAKAGIEGAGVGAAGGVAVNALGELANQAGKIPEALSEAKAPETSATEDTLNSRIKDATASYKSVLKKGDITSQITDANGEKINRVDEGKGLLGKRQVNSNLSETANGTELNNIKNYPDDGSFLEKTQATNRAISTEAQNYKAGLATEDKSAPLVDTAKDQIYKGVFDNLNGDARDAFLGNNNKLLSQAGQPIEVAKSIVGRYGQDVAEATSKYDGSRLGIQTLKEDLETAYQNARGNSAYGSEQRNAIDNMNSSIRDYLKGELSSSTKNTDVLGSLDKQSKLYRAKDVLQNKAEEEATSHYGRIVQAHPALRRVSNIFARQGIMVPLRVLEAAAGITVVTAAAKKLAP